MGTIWSSSPWMRRWHVDPRQVLTEVALGELAMQSCAAFRLTCIPIELIADAHTRWSLAGWRRNKLRSANSCERSAAP